MSAAAAALGRHFGNGSQTLTGGRVTIGSATLYALLEQFTAEGFLERQPTSGRGHVYRPTGRGGRILVREYRRLRSQTGNSVKVFGTLPADHPKEEDVP